MKVKNNKKINKTKMNKLIKIYLFEKLRKKKS